jgi:lipopolysaccharide biosynthesis regulator YciM
MLEFPFWALLALPLLFLAGWLARGYEARVRVAEQGGAPQALFRGVNLLLNDQPDAAIDAFISVAQADPRTVELHHALANLFRRRGEFERAVRIHTFLVGRGDLPAAEQARAVLELAHDYLKGGMLDRAEAHYAQLLDQPTWRFAALRELLRIHAMTRDWDKAIERARELEREAGENHRVDIAHFHCEQAERALAGGQRDEAARQLEEARVADPRSVRAAALAGQLALDGGDARQAIESWRQIAERSPEHLPLVAERLALAMDSAGEREGALELLRTAMLQQPNPDLIEVASRRIAQWQGTPVAEALVHEALQRQPSLGGFERLLALRAAAAPDAAELEQLRSLISVQARRLARYRCRECGFRTRSFTWQCPGCQAWDTYPPRRLEELDAA